MATREKAAKELSVPKEIIEEFNKLKNPNPVPLSKARENREMPSNKPNTDEQR